MNSSIESSSGITRQRIGRWLLWSVPVVLLVSGAWYLWAGDADQPNYIRETVVRGDLENLVTATGSLQPRDYVDVGAQVSGQLKKLLVDVGSEVKAGDLLAEIDATVYAAKVDATRAQLTNLNAQLLDRQAQLQLAEIQYQRQQNLQKEDATTAEALQSAEASVKSARAQLKALEAQIKQQESTLRVEAANLNFANIYAPMDGTVVTIDARQGQTLNATQVAPTIMRVADLSTMTVKTQVSEADVSKLREGMEVYFTTLGGQDRRWYSKLEQIQPTPEVVNNVVLYNALFNVPNEQRVLMTQMSTQVFFIVSQAKNALLVPVSALNYGPLAGGPRGIPPGERPDTAGGTGDNSSIAAETARAGDGSGDRRDAANRERRPREAGSGERPAGRPAMVKVINAKGDIEERRVRVGVSNRVQAEILEGLSEGEEVIAGQRSTSQPAARSNQAGPGFGGPRMLR